MAIKKTLEEIREGQRRRAKKWREANVWKHRERVKEAYGKSQAQKLSPDGVTEQELERYGKKVGGLVVIEPRRVQETVHVSMDEVEADPEVMRQQREMMEGRRGIKQAPLAVPRSMEPKQEVPRYEVTEEHVRVAEELAAKVAQRKKQRELEEWVG